MLKYFGRDPPPPPPVSILQSCIPARKKAGAHILSEDGSEKRRVQRRGRSFAREARRFANHVLSRSDGSVAGGARGALGEKRKRVTAAARFLYVEGHENATGHRRVVRDRGDLSPLVLFVHSMLHLVSMLCCCLSAFMPNISAAKPSSIGPESVRCCRRAERR